MGHMADQTDFVSALPGKLGAVTVLAGFNASNGTAEVLSVFLIKVRGCRDLHAQNLKRSIFLPVGEKAKAIK